MYTVWLALRSLILWTASTIYFLVACMFLIFLSFFKDPRYNDRPQRVLMRSTLHVAGARLRLHYAPAFDPNRTALFICNHVNIFDPMVIYSAIPQFVRGMELESHFRIPGYGWMARRFGNIPLPKNHGKAEIREIARRIKAALDSGVSIIVFAEGHRTRDGRVARFQKGIFRMACEFGYPVAPMSILGSYEFKNRHSLMLRPATIEVFLHDLIETEGSSPRDADDLRERVHAVVSRPVDASLAHADLPEELRAYRTARSRDEVFAGVSSAPEAPAEPC